MAQWQPGATLCYAAGLRFIPHISGPAGLPWQLPSCCQSESASFPLTPLSLNDMLQAVWQEMYQRRKSVDDSLIMTNKWSHAMLPAELFWGQTEFKWEKKNRKPHGTFECFRDKWGIQRAQSKKCLSCGNNANKSDDADDEVAKMWRC